MFLFDARIRWQARMASLLGRKREPAPPPVGEDRLLTQNETASMLQPHMRNRNTLAWLELDRNVDPSLPYVAEASEILYHLADVRAFIRRLPQTSLASGTSGTVGQALADRRSGDDRRYGELLNLVEERRTTIDRRSGFDRRTCLDRRQTKDDFGYGRNGNRRGLAGKL